MQAKTDIKAPKAQKKIRGKYIAMELVQLLLRKGFRKFSKARSGSNECVSHYLGKPDQPFRLRIADHPIGVQNVDVVVNYLIPEEGITYSDLTIKADELEREYFEQITKRRTKH